MALDNFKTQFVNTYQEVFPKVLVAMKIANTRLQSDLSYGSSVERIAYDISGVTVQDITLHNDMTVQSVTDSSESLTVNNFKGTIFPMSTKEKKQAGPLSPAETIGGQVAIKLATYVDADVLAEVTNAEFDFDTGDLTTLTSTGVPIDLTSTTVPQMATRMSAKLRYKNNQTIANMAFVSDAYSLADISQFMLGKDIDIANAIFQNGFVNEQFASAEMYVSENLKGEAVLGLATNPTNGDTITINGITFTFQATLSVAGGLHIGSSVDATRANMAVAFNDIGSAIAEATDTGYQVISAADQATWNALRITATDSAAADTLTLVGTGSGRFVLAETLTDGTDTWDTTMIHAYYGKKGAIDVVVQEEVDMLMTQEPKQPTMNIINHILYGIKTFADGSKKFLDVLIDAS